MPRDIDGRNKFSIGGLFAMTGVDLAPARQGSGGHDHTVVVVREPAPAPSCPRQCERDQQLARDRAIFECADYLRRKAAQCRCERCIEDGRDLLRNMADLLIQDLAACRRGRQS
jgi:hypothetical protein